LPGQQSPWDATNQAMPYFPDWSGGGDGLPSPELSSQFPQVSVQDDARFLPYRFAPANFSSSVRMNAAYEGLPLSQVTSYSSGTSSNNNYQPTSQGFSSIDTNFDASYDQFTNTHNISGNTNGASTNYLEPGLGDWYNFGPT